MCWIHFFGLNFDCNESIDFFETYSTSVCFHEFLSVFFSRFIVLRRLCLLLGLLYGYRAITMFVTVLPISNPNYQCDPKLTESGQYLTVLIVLKRAVKILSGFGLSMNGQHVFCGDFIFSGHTMIFLLCYLVIVECKNSKFLSKLFLFHET